MPIYEYQCRKCKREFSFLYGMTKDSTDPRCPRCGSKRLARLVSRFASPRSEEDMLDSLEPSHLDPDNPKEVINWMKKLGKEMGEDADFADEMEAAMEEEMAAEREGREPSETGDSGAGDRDELF